MNLPTKAERAIKEYRATIEEERLVNIIVSILFCLVCVIALIIF